MQRGVFSGNRLQNPWSARDATSKEWWTLSEVERSMLVSAQTKDLFWGKMPTY